MKNLVFALLAVLSLCSHLNAESSSSELPWYWCQSFNLSGLSDSLEDGTTVTFCVGNGVEEFYNPEILMSASDVAVTMDISASEFQGEFLSIEENVEVYFEKHQVSMIIPSGKYKVQKGLVYLDQVKFY